MSGIFVLSVDDNEDDHFLIRRAWKKSGSPHSLQLASDGQKAIEYLGHIEAFPALVLLDLKMPRKSGFEVLEWLRAQPDLEAIPVAILTSSENRADIERAYNLGATWYFSKPVDSDELVQLIFKVNEWLENSESGVFTASPHFKSRTDL